MSNKRKLSPAAQAERTMHLASTVIDGAKRRHGAAMLVNSAMEDIRIGLSSPNGRWSEQERATRARILQKLEDAAELLEGA